MPAYIDAEPLSMHWTRDEFRITNQPPTASVESTYRLLQTTYWAHVRPIDVVEKLLQNSLCFFLLRDEKQIGFGRVITDYTTTSWVADVIIVSEFQGQGLGSWMMQCMLEHSDIKQTQFVLQTGTAHDFYERLGFAKSENLMSTGADYLD
ncbi:MAG: GNAT family N-acetyltransferase [Planctomycetota bacterium]